MTKRKNMLMTVLLVSAMMVITACGGGTAAKVPAETASDEMGEVMTITHELGEIKLKKNPETVVVFDYGLLDIMDNLEVEVSGLPMGNMPSFLEKYKDEDKYTNVGTLKEPDFEKVYEMAPDVIFISARTAEAYEELSKIAPVIYMAVDNADYMGSVAKNAGIIGELFGKEKAAEDKAAELAAKAESIKEKVEAKGENALIILANDGSLSAYGAVSRFGILHSALGYKESDTNIEQSTHGQSVTYEYILERNPQNLFVVDRAAVVGGEADASSTMDNDIIKETEAFKSGRIHYLSPEVWYITSGGFTGTGFMLDEVEAAMSK